MTILCANFLSFDNYSSTKTRKTQMNFKDKTKFCDKIVRYFHKVDRPTYAGEIALELGCSLACAEECIEDLVYESVIRPATSEEIRDTGGRNDARVFVLTKRASLKIANVS